jgi:hypothetical protein
MDWRIVAALVVAVGGACGEGGLTVRLNLPEEPSLSPISEQAAAEVALVVRDGEGSRQRLSRTGESRGGLDLGRLGEGEVELAVELLGSNGRLLGYGKAPGAIEIESGRDVEVEINVRRPLVYLSGHPTELATFDASQDASSTITSGVRLGQVAAATACSADGSEIFVVTEGASAAELTALSTSTHQLGSALASVAPRVGDLAVSGARGFAAVGHRADPANAGGGITLVDLAQPGSPSFFEIGDTRRVVIDETDGTAWALVNSTVICPVAGDPPPPNAELHALGLTLSQELSAPVIHQGTAADLAIDPETQTLYIADPCAGAVLAMAPGATELEKVLDLPAASAVAIHDGMLTAAGNASVTGGVALALVTLDLMLSGADPVTITLPALKERAVSRDLDEAGQAVEVVAGADAAAVVDMAVVPGTDRIALVSLAAFLIEATIDSGFEVTPDMLLAAWEYQVVDATGALVQRVRTLCDLEVEIDANTIFTEWACGQADNQNVSEVEFEPRTLNVLFGSR